MDKFSSISAPPRQQGVVLIATMITLLVVTVVVFASVRSSTLNTKISVVKEMQSATFQAAESGLLMLSASVNNLPVPTAGSVNCFNVTSNFEPGCPVNIANANPAINAISVRDGAALGTNVDVNIIASGAASYRGESFLGNSLSNGGLVTHVYELRVRANTDGGVPTASTVAMGVKVLGPGGGS